ncbi:MAG: ABC transporter permease [Actinomycetota bacterium]|nr:ABC transporter permease [Actinomycetota bacterium]
MRLVLLMAGNDLRRRLRDRSALVTAFIAPFALASIISIALGGATGGFEATIGVVDADGSDVTRGLVVPLLASPQGGERRADDDSPIRFVSRSSEEEAAGQVADGKLGAAIVFPAGFGSSLASGSPISARVVRDADRPVTGDVAASIARGLVARVDAAQLSVALLTTTGPVPPDRLPELAARAGQAVLPITLSESAPGGDLPLAAYFGPSMAMVFLFLTVGFGARSLLAERRTGTLARLRAAPTTPEGIVAAKTVSVLVLGLASILTLWLATSVLFGASWGSPPLVLALCVATVFAIAGISALVTALARTEQQAEGLTSMVTFTLAILGGNFVPPEAFPGLLARLSLLTPNGWALRAFSEVSAGDGGWAEVLPALGVLLAVGVVTGGVAIRFLQRLVRA